LNIGRNNKISIRNDTLATRRVSPFWKDLTKYGTQSSEIRRSKMKPRKPRQVKIDLAVFQKTRWPHFSAQRTIISGGQKLFRELILDNHVSSSLKGPCTHHDVVMHITKHAAKPVEIESIPKELGLRVLLRGKIVFGHPGNCIENVARNYDGMHWWMSEVGLNLGVIASLEPNISRFDALAGRLIYEARSERRLSHRFPPGVIARIASRIDREGLKPHDCLVGTARRELTIWNQKHPNQTIHTFVAAVQSKVKNIRKGAKRRLYLAGDIYKSVCSASSRAEVRTIS
jgi:hypothetical protein